MRDVIVGCRRKFGPPPRAFAREMAPYLRITKPDWLTWRFWDRMNVIYRQQHRILAEGEIVWGHIVQANTLLFEPGSIDCPAQGLYSFDPRVDDKPHVLQQWATELFDLKGTRQSDRSLAQVSSLLAHEMRRTMHFQAPLQITREVAVFMPAIMVARKHLPAGYLSEGLFPLVIHRQTNLAMILPAFFWDHRLVDHWVGRPAAAN